MGFQYRVTTLGGAIFAIAASAQLQAAVDAATLAKAAQNPVADLMSFPLQNNTNFDVGPRDQTQDVLNFQPVIPVELTSDWNVVTRTILSAIWQPDFGTGGGTTTGLGDLTLSAFLAPSKPGSWIWGVGPVLLAPTATNTVLGTGKWGIGPTAVVLHLEKGSPWVYGALVNNISSFAGSGNRPPVNQMLFQPFVNYNIPGRPGLALSFSPIVTANWEASGRNVWTAPLGLGVSQILPLGGQWWNVSAAVYDNVVRPAFGPTWTLRATITLLIPRQ